MKKCRVWFDDLSLYKKILLILFVSLLCIYLVFYGNIRYLSRNYEQELYKAHAQSLNYISVSVAAQMQAIESISNNIIGDDVIQDNLYELKNPDEENEARQKRNVYNALYSYTFFNDYIKSINIILKNGNNICMGNTDDINKFDIAKLRVSAAENKGKLKWEPSLEAGKSAVCYRQFRQQKYLTFEWLADVYIVADLEKLIRDALEDSGYPTEDSGFVLLDGYKRIYPDSPYFDESYQRILERMKASGKGYSIEKPEKEEKLVIEGKIPGTDWQYLYFLDYDLIFRNIQAVKIRVFVFTSIVVVFMLLVLRIIFRFILKHLDFLVEKMQCFGNGQEIPEQMRGCNYAVRRDEIGQLHQSFDEMTRNVKTLRDQNYEKQLLLQEAMIKMLQQQINPHFLYNTLDTINWMAQKYGVEEISEMAKSLGNLFRVSINGKEDLIPLAEELVVLDNYVRIQKIRFRDRLEFKLDIPDSVSEMMVPKLCIQPLVENALKHALEYTDDVCCIYVKIQQDREILRIKVSNTGSQFTENLLYKIENGEIKSDGSGVGLTNIHSRLKLLYGEEYGLNFYNDDEWAVVVLEIPQKRRG